MPMSLVLAALLLAPAAGSPSAEPQPFFACPAGFTLETSAAPGPQRVVAVRCTAPRVAVPVCPAGSSLTVAAGPDTCLPGRGGTTAVVDGASNTIAFGESAPVRTGSTGTAAITDGTSNTIAIGETAAAPTPGCRLVGEVLRIDSQRTRDECIRTEVRAPTQPVTITSRG